MPGSIATRVGKDGSTSYYLRLSAGKDPVTGKYRVVSRKLTGSTKRERDRQAREFEAEVDAGRHSGTDATMADLLDRWMAMRQPHLSAKTHAEQAGYIRRTILPAIGHKKVRKLETVDLDMLYLGLAQAGMMPRTIDQVHAIIRAALKQAEVWKWVPSNVARHATKPPVHRAEVHSPAPEVVRRLIDHLKADQPELATFIFLAADSGGRRGELCGLRWSDVAVAPGGGVVSIRQAVGVVGRAAPYTKDPKNHQVRHLPISAATVRALDLHRARMAGRGTVSPGSYLFSDTLDGAEPWNPDRVSERFRRACKNAGVTGVRLHDLRHFTASQLIDAGVPITTVAYRLGHAKPSTTTDIYGHRLESADEQAATIMGALLELEPGTTSAPPPDGDGA